MPAIRLVAARSDGFSEAPVRSIFVVQMKNIKNYAERLFLWPLFGGITTIFGVIAGYLGSHYDKEVSSALYPWFWTVEATEKLIFSSEATFFWVFVLLFGASFTGTFWAQARSSNRATAELQAATNQVSGKADSLNEKTEVLDGLIRQLYTLPPKGFLESYGNAIRMANEAFFDTQGADATEEDIALAIRVQLALILQLASGFDDDGEKSEYGCNLMAFLPSGLISEANARKIDSRMKFVETGVTVTRLKGALVLIQPLSVSSSALEGPDPKLSQFALPVLDLPLDAVTSEQGKSILPGAPLAFARRAETAIESLDDWFERTAPFSEKIRGELKRFFEDQKDVLQSFISIPLYAEPTANGEDQEPIGVLNIHRNMPNKLLAEKLELFAPLVTPIAILLGRLLSAYSQKSATLITD